MLNSLGRQGSSPTITEILKDMHAGLKARIITEICGEYFSIEKGVRQEDPLSPLILNSSPEEIFRGLNWEDKGFCINGEKLNNLRFADDVVVISDNGDDLMKMIEDLERQGEMSGLEINYEKSKILTNKTGVQKNLEKNRNY